MYVISALGAVGVGLGIAFRDDLDGGFWVLQAVMVLLVVVGAVAARLTVTVDDAAVTATFGWGWPRRRVELVDVVSVERVRNSWWHGWGIRKVSRGWMFNAAGYDAVELTLRSGRVFRIGTDEPAALLAAIEGRGRASAETRGE